YDGMRKEPLVDALDERLRADPQTFMKHPQLRDFYGGRTGSPVKRERNSSALADEEDKSRSRRKTLTSKVKEELDAL
ncbi:hypothetical protein LTS18_001122, partial [Coniosporium uncinatum]